MLFKSRAFFPGKFISEVFIDQFVLANLQLFRKRLVTQKL
jgi:hypothetical protein